MLRKEIHLPEKLKRIEQYTFRYCTSLENIELPESLTFIGNYAFAFCPGLTEITLPETVTSIGDSVFDGCENLEAVYVEKGSYAEIYCIDNELPYVYLPV